MTQQQFIEYLFSPEKLNSSSIDALEKLVMEYPYFQIGRMLYLKNLHNQNSIDYEKNLALTSAYLSNRQVLYDFIKKKTSLPAPRVLGDEKKNIPAAELLKLLTQNEILLSIEPMVVLQEMPLYLQSDITIETTERKHELQQEEKQIQKETTAPAPLFETLTPSHETLCEFHSFNDWLKITSGKSLQQIREEKGIEKKQKVEIIQRFILEETAKSTPKPKTEFYSAEAMAKKSLQDDETFVTETLAKIYLQQGNLSKAQRAYEILIVKHPEKIHIFAPLLEKIKKLQEGQKSK